jgi:polar amino acid transport system substrate-binding protein
MRQAPDNDHTHGNVLLLFVYSLLLYAVALGLTSLQARADTFTVVADEWEGYTQADGSGYWFDLMRLLYEPLGHTLIFRTVPYPRALEEIRKGKSQITPATYRGDLDDNHTELSVIIEQDNVDAFVLAQNFPDWRGAESLAGRRVVARLEYGYDRFLPSNIIYSEKPQLEGMLKMLVLGRVDAVLDYSADVQALVNSGAVTASWVVKPGIIQPAEYAAFALTTEGQRARAIFRSRMGEIIEGDDIQPLMDKYRISPRYRPFLAPTTQPANLISP